MGSLIATLRKEAAPVELQLLLQTNGLLLDEDWFRLFVEHKVGVGVSLDGPPEIADKSRVYRNGRGSTNDLLNNLARLRSSSPLFQQLNFGYLCVINPAIHGGKLVRWFLEQSITSVDLLLPHGNYVNPPDDWKGVEEYARFLIEAYDEWYRLDAMAPDIRLFELMTLGHLGVRPKLDALGGDLNNLCVIESDGSIGVTDVLRFIGGEFSQDQINISDHPLDSRTETYSIDELQKPGRTCRECPQFVACGGGYLPHRFDGRTFRNPSIYCEALYGLSERIFANLRQTLPENVFS